MSTIFAVYISGGEYDDSYHNLIKCWSTREAAEQHIRELEDFRARQNQALELREAHYKKWDLENPFTLQYPEQKKYPKWHGVRSQDITDAMRAERIAIMAENDAKRKEYQDLHEEHNDQRWNACKTYLESAGISKDLVEWLDGYSMYFREDAEYSIEPVEMD